MTSQLRRSDSADELCLMFKRREETIREINRRRQYDLAVVGGGIHGAIFARLAAFNGLRTVLLESGDYACGASGLSAVFSGAVQLDFSLSALLSSRKRTGLLLDLVQTAGRLATFCRYRLPRGMPGLPALHARVQEFFLGGKLGPPDGLPGSGLEFPGICCDERRIILENIFAARQEGAECLNYASVQSVSSIGGAMACALGWRDNVAGQNHELQARAIINCAGAAAPAVGSLRTPESPLRFLRQTDLLFKPAWQQAAIVFAPEQGEQLAVQPLEEGVLVSLVTQEGGGDYLQRAFDVLERRVPGQFSSAGLLWACSARRAVLPGSAPGRWVWHRGMYTLYGGNFACAAATVWEGFKSIVARTAGGFSPVPLFGRRLPGAGLTAEVERDFCALADKYQLSPQIAARVLRRLGGRVRLIADKPGNFEVLEGDCLRAEVELAVCVDQARTSDDILVRRMGLPGRSSSAGLVSKIELELSRLLS